MARVRFAVISFLLSALMVTPVFAQSDIPYNHPPAVNDCSGANNWSTVNAGLAGFDKQVGVKDSDFTGRTITSIAFYMCSVRLFTNGLTSNCPIPGNDTQTVTIGIFNAGTGALVQSFGTASIQTIQCGFTSGQTPTLVTVTGSHTMLSTEMVGLSFSFTQDGIRITCASAQTNCAGAILSNGGVIDCTTSCSAQSTGFGLGGTFFFLGQPVPTVPASVQSSSFLPAFFIIVLAGIATAKSDLDFEQKIKLGTGILIAGGMIMFAVVVGGL